MNKKVSAMKHKTKSLIVALCFCINYAFAQTFTDIFDSASTITYLGIDYTHVKIFGEKDNEVIDIVDRQFNNINQLVLTESSKYNLKKTFKKNNLPNDLSFVTERNKTIDTTTVAPGDIVSIFHLTVNDIHNIVRHYNFGGKTGIGFLFIMESMSKLDERGTVYCTFIDMASKKVLFTKRLTEKAGGFGLRNYWARPIYEAIDDMGNKDFDLWVRK